jgi:hypothetical protein
VPKELLLLLVVVVVVVVVVGVYYCQEKGLHCFLAIFLDWCKNHRSNTCNIIYRPTTFYEKAPKIKSKNQEN